MKKDKIFPLILLILGFVLIMADLLTTEDVKLGFWLRSASNILLILAMVLVLKRK